MKVKIENQNGYLADKYSKYAIGNNSYAGYPITSFPIVITEVPEQAVSLALALVDYDSVPVCGFTWIHWLACNISAKISYIPENASQNEAIKMLQGQNSAASKFIGAADPKLIYRYIGPCPPDQDHDYHLTVYALDKFLDLKEGFYLNEFYKAMTDHILIKSETIVKGKV